MSGNDHFATQFLALHGFTGEGADFSALSSSISGKWHCPDLPGHGSRKHAHPDEFSLPSLENTLLGSNRKTATGLGYSMGGRLLLNLAVRNPHFFARLILISCSPGLTSAEERRQRRISDEKWIHTLENTSLNKFLAAWWEQPIMRGMKNLPQHERDEIFARRRNNSPDGLVRSLQNHGTGVLPSLWEQLPEIQIPTLIIVGAEDQKFREIGASMAEKLPRSNFCIIPNSGHAPHIENPGATADRIQSFLLS